MMIGEGAAMCSPKIQKNQLYRIRKNLLAIKRGEISFRSHFGWEVRNCFEVVDYLYGAIVKELWELVLDGQKSDILYGPFHWTKDEQDRELKEIEARRQAGPPETWHQ